MAKFGKFLFGLCLVLAICLALFSVFLFFSLPANAPDFAGPNEGLIMGLVFAGLFLCLGLAFRFAFVRPSGLSGAQKGLRYITLLAVVFLMLFVFAELFI